MTNFEKAFASARKAGKKVFTWNGKSYNTKLRSDLALSKAAPPKSRPAAAVKPTAPTTTSSLAGRAKMSPAEKGAANMATSSAKDRLAKARAAGIARERNSKR